MMGGERLTIRRLAPSIGEHNQEIYAEELRLSPSAIAPLQAVGVIYMCGTPRSGGEQNLAPEGTEITAEWGSGFSSSVYSVGCGGLILILVCRAYRSVFS